MTFWLRFFAALAAFVIVLLVYWNGASYQSPPMLAKQTFGTLSGVLMVFALFAGMFQTADCLSSEKRDGTLGLLFLTDLHGYDVVLGKLAACSLNCFYGMVSTLPVLAISLLVGGVTLGEFWRMVLVLVVGLFFSLGIGMLVSSLTRDSRQSLGLSMLLIIFFAGILPAIHAALITQFKINISAPLLWPSLGYTEAMAYDAFYSSRTGSHNFWGSLLTIAGLGASGLVAASVIVPRAWQEKSRSSDSGKISFWRRLRFGSARRREALREPMTTNPFYWLTVRDRLPQMGFWILIGVVAPIWLVFGYTVLLSPARGFRQMVPYQFMVMICAGVNLIFKCLVTAEVSRRLNDDRKSGALELLLVTPLTERAIVDGQRRALSGQFLIPMLFLELAMGLLMWLQLSPSLSQYRDNGIMSVMVIGNMVMLLIDFLALGWVGMWTGLSARNHHRAILATLLRILVLPWLLYFVLGILGFFNARTPTPLFVTWYILCIVNNAIWSGKARIGLRNKFRRWAAGAEGKMPRLEPSAMEHQES